MIGVEAGGAFCYPCADLRTDKDRVEGQSRQSAAKHIYPLADIEFIAEDQIGFAPVATESASALESIVANLDAKFFSQSFKFLQENGFVHIAYGVGCKNRGSGRGEQGNCWDRGGRLL